MQNTKVYDNPLIYLAPSPHPGPPCPPLVVGVGGQNKLDEEHKSRRSSPDPTTNLDFPVYLIVIDGCNKGLLRRNIVRQYFMPSYYFFDFQNATGLTRHGFTLTNSGAK